ncbi:Mur ligase family protein [Paenibacillus sp. 2RAB27]|uniref:Mur ligase family protein n=1 Tax=Paenibacillus sp. 2RAB27 TaxID=3232991 RepID=UPI003F97D42A
MKDTRYAIAYISDIFFGQPSNRLDIIGVTGTKGKTTTTFMIKSILEAARQKDGLIGTLGTRIGDEMIQTERTTPEAYDLQYYGRDS